MVIPGGSSMPPPASSAQNGSDLMNASTQMLGLAKSLGLRGSQQQARPAPPPASMPPHPPPLQGAPPTGGMPMPNPMPASPSGMNPQTANSNQSLPPQLRAMLGLQ